jgi:hypothetical protein
MGEFDVGPNHSGQRALRDVDLSGQPILQHAVAHLLDHAASEDLLKHGVAVRQRDLVVEFRTRDAVADLGAAGNTAGQMAEAGLTRGAVLLIQPARR